MRTGRAIFFSLWLARILKIHVRLVTHLLVRRVGNADAAGFRYAFEPGRDIHAVAQDVIAFDQHVAQIDADAKQHPPVLLNTRITVRHEFLDRYPALDRGYDRGKLRQHAVAGALDNPAPRAGDDRIDGGSMRAKSQRRARLIDTHQPAVAGHIHDEDGGQPAFDSVVRGCDHRPAFWGVLNRSEGHSKNQARGYKYNK